MAEPARRLAAVGDLLAIPEEDRFHEVVNGELVEKEAARGKHGGAQASVVAAVFAYRRQARPSGPSGWLFATEIEVELAPHEVYRPDVAGWRRENLAELPDEAPIRVRPDWTCEVLSPKTRRRDKVDKFRGYHAAGVGHHWILDPHDETLAVYRWHEAGYLVVLSVGADRTVRAEPFAEVEIHVGGLFGHEADR